MKFTKLAVAAMFAFAASSAYAFHSGGVAECDGCHTMHNSLGNASMRTFLTQFQAGPYLLQANDQSGACLNCHQNDDGKSYHISTSPGALQSAGYVNAVPKNMSPGGDFGWLRADIPYSIRNTPGTNFGEERGHNIIAQDFTYTEDTSKNGAAPGGTYPTNKLACSSCHDPHGKYRQDINGVQSTSGAPIAASGSYAWGTGNSPFVGKANVAVGVFRLLGGVGYLPKSMTGVTGVAAFAAPSPAALVASSYNVGSSWTGVAGGEGATPIKEVYGSGMSEWCGNCHARMHEDTYTSGAAGLVHPAGNGAKLTQAIVDNYNSYVSSGILTTGANKWTNLVPVELGLTSLTDMNTAYNTITSTNTWAAVTTGANVNCLSCHRAHASGFGSMLRYAHENEFMTIGDSAGAAIYDTNTTENKINLGFVTAFAQGAQYNGRQATAFGQYQRLLCNKCHAKD